MNSRRIAFGWAQRPRWVGLGLALILAACTNSGASRDPGGALRVPSAPAERPTGCIDTPFVGPDHHTSTVGVVCGREASPAAMMVRGHVVQATESGLPGPGLEGLWVSVHAIDGAVQLTRLPPARAEVQTGPQGAFTVGLGSSADREPSQEYLIVVRERPDGPALAAQRIEAGARPSPELNLRVFVPPPSE